MSQNLSEKMKIQVLKSVSWRDEIIFSVANKLCPTLII